MSTPLKALIDRLTPSARLCLEQAASRSLARSHFEVEIEHVLLAIMDHDQNAARSALHALGAPLPQIEHELENALDSFRSGNTRNPVLSTWLPVWLEKAWLLASAERMESQVSTLDLLLVLYSDPALRNLIQGASPALAQLDPAAAGHGYARLREHGNECSHDHAAQAEHSAPPRRSGSPALDKYSIDLMALARAGKIDPVLGRDSEIRQMVDILMRRRQNNPILTGEPGVGKTAVVEGLALKIVHGEVPLPLQHVALRTLDLGLLQAGASVKGEFESRLRQVIDEVKASVVPVILFIDEAHTLIGAGGSAGQNDAANLLKPALARGELRTIAATTWAEYKKYFEKDAALARRFQLVKVEEPSTDAAIQMVRGLSAAMAGHHRVDILDEAVRAAVTLSSRYLSGRQLPDKAISVLDTACARVALSRAGKPAALADLETLIANIDRETAALQREQGHEARLDALARQRAQHQQQLAQLDSAWQAQQQLVDDIHARQTATPRKKTARTPTVQQQRQALQTLQQQQALAFDCVDANVIADVIAGWTGIPLGRMVGNELQQVRRLAEHLGERVLGQPHALAMIAERVQIAKADLDDPGKPKGVFLLVGPSGVGKTETALALAEALYGGERSLITINMSEYQEAHSVAGLKGSPPGYVGYGDGGVLTEAVRRKPYSVVLLDEAEKAHPDVMELFFQVFDKGVLEDGEGREIDFRNTIILLTANSGSELLQRACEHGVRVDNMQRPPTADDLVAVLRPTLQQVFKPALLGRLSIVPYFPISDDILRSIINLKLDKIRQRIARNHGAELQLPDSLSDYLARRCMDVDSGARDADAILGRTLLAPLSGRLLERMADGRAVRKITVTVKGEQLQLRLS